MRLDSSTPKFSSKAASRVSKIDLDVSASNKKSTDLGRTISFDVFSGSRSTTPEPPQLGRKTGPAAKSLDLHDDIAIGSSAKMCNGVIRQQGQNVYVKNLKTKEPSAELLVELNKEVTMHQQLNHANVIKCVGARLRPPKPFIVFQATSIGSLRHVLDKPLSYPITWKDRLLLSKDIACGLSYLHSHNICHGDVKAFNVMVCPEHGRLTARLMEFGAIKFRVHFDQEAHPDRLHRSLAWNPPEAIRGLVEKSVQGDVYSFGLVMYELATGKMPYTDRDAYRTKHAILQGVQPRLPKDCPEAYVQLIQSCLRSKPDDRPDLSKVIESLQDQLEAYAGPDSEMLYEPQAEYVCPLSGEVMLDPVKIETGAVYDRAAIEKWFASGKRTCPVTRSDVRRIKSMEPMRELQLKIKEWHARQLQKANHRVRSGTDYPIDDLSSPISRTLSSLTDSGKPLDSRPGSPTFDLSVRRLEMLKAGSKAMIASAPASPYASSLATSPYHLETPTPTTITDTGSPFGPARSVKAIMQEITPVCKALAGKMDCESKRLDAQAVIELARRGHAYRAQLVKAGVIPHLAKMFKCSHTSCQKVAIHAVRVLAPRPEDEDAFVSRPKGLKKFIMRVTCSMGAFAIAGPDAVQQLLDADGLKNIVRILDSPHSSTRSDAMLLLVAISNCPQHVQQLAKFSILRSVVSVLQTSESAVSVSAAVTVLLRLVQSNKGVSYSLVSAGTVEPLVQCLCANDHNVAAKAAWILSALAEDEDTAAAIGTASAANLVELLNQEDTQEAAVALVLATSNYDLTRQLLLQHKVVHALVNVLKAKPLFMVGVMEALILFADNPTSCNSIASEGTIELVLGALQSTESSPAVAEKAVELLYHLIPVASGPQSGPIIPVLSACLGRQHESSHVYACKCMARLAANDDSSKVAVADSGALPHLVNVLRSGKKEVRAAAAEVLACLAVMSEYSGVVGHYGIMRELHGMLSQSAPLGCRVAAAELLRNMAKWEANHQCIVEGSIVPQLVVLMKDRVARAAALDAVLLLAANREFMGDIIDSGVIPRLLPMTAKHEKSQQTALDLLRQLCETPSGREAVVRSHAIPILAKSMSSPAKAVRDAAAHALCDITADGRFQAAVSKENVIGLLVEFLRRSDWGQQCTLVSALSNLAKVDSTVQYSIMTAGAVPPLIQFLEGKDTRLRIAAAVALGELGNKAPAHQKMIASRGALTPLVAMLHDPSPDVQCAAVESLMQLTKNNASTQLLAKEEGAVEPLVKLLTAGPAPCKTAAALALANLTFDEDVRKLVAS